MKPFIKKIISLVMACFCFISITACGEKECSHSYTSATTKEATCKETGIKTYTCTLCGNTYMENIAKLTTHSYTSEITKEATCAENGIMTYTCSKCGDSYSEDIVKTSIHKGILHCTLCNKNFYNILKNHIETNSNIIRFTDSKTARGLSFLYFDNSNSYTVEIIMWGNDIFFVIYADVPCYIEIEISPLKYNIGVRVLDMTVSNSVNPQSISSTWNSFRINDYLSENYISDKSLANNIKCLLKAVNYYFKEQQFGFSAKDFGFVNYPIIGE